MVAASDGHQVGDATVQLVDPTGQLVATTTTGEDGGYVFDALAADRYTLTASGYAPVAIEVVVDEDAVSSLQVQLGTPHHGLQPAAVLAE